MSEGREEEGRGGEGKDIRGLGMTFTWEWGACEGEGGVRVLGRRLQECESWAGRAGKEGWGGGYVIGGL